MLPTDSQARKNIPIYRGFVKCFPDAMAAVAQLTAVAAKQHHPDGGIYWDKEKSVDELDALLRHMLDDVMEPLSRDAEGALHAVKIAWRGMANLQRLADSGVNIFVEEPRPQNKWEWARKEGLLKDDDSEYKVTLDENWFAATGTIKGFPRKLS